MRCWIRATRSSSPATRCTARTGLPVGDIAAHCGFKSVYHFSRHVRQQTGARPSVVRQQRWTSVSPARRRRYV
jgi:AraC-like DNA-binding protein